MQHFTILVRFLSATDCEQLCDAYALLFVQQLLEETIHGHYLVYITAVNNTPTSNIMLALTAMLSIGTNTQATRMVNGYQHTKFAKVSQHLWSILGKINITKV